MLAGIGVLIVASQFHVMMDDKPRENAVQNLLSIPQAISKGLPWPTWGTHEQRKARVELLQQFGKLHERQGEIHAAVEDYVAAVHSAGPAGQSPRAPAALVADQGKIIDDLVQVLDRIDATKLAPSGELQGEDLKVALRDSIARAEAARRDLDEGNVQGALATQGAALDAIATVLAKLKNHDFAAKLGLLTILIIVAWQALAPRRFRLLPAPLVAILIVTGLAAWWSLPVLYVELPDQITDGIHWLSWAVIQDVDWRAIVGSALLIAAIASAETLLCATAVDQLHHGPRTKYDRELAAQGVGNMICGFLGALPMTGVIVRSAANVQAGGQSRWSAVMHGLWLLLFVAFLSAWLRLIPTAALAAILVYTGYKLVHPKAIRELWQVGKSEVLVYVATMVTIVVEDLLTGVIVGLVLSAGRLLLTFSRLRTRLTIGANGRRATLALEGAATFLRLPVLADKLESVPPGVDLHVDLQHLDYIDHACLELLVNWAKQHEATGGKLTLDWDALHARFRRVIRRSSAVVPSTSSDAADATSPKERVASGHRR